MIRAFRPQTQEGDLTQGGITGAILRFAAPMIACNLLQQCYNIADTLIVGRFLGAGALAAVGSTYALMVFLTSIFIGLCMGSGALFSLRFGAREYGKLRRTASAALLLTGTVSLLLNVAVLLCAEPLVRLMRTPAELEGVMYDYLFPVSWGIVFTFLYNFYAFALRAVGNSAAPFRYLAAAVALNIALDLLFIAVFGWGVKGAAAATVLAQALSGIGLCRYTLRRYPVFRPAFGRRPGRGTMREIAAYASLTCIQQSVMNFGILMVQGLVNTFGTTAMAAFAAGVKIDSFAYMPVQDFGNAFSTFVAQNFGAGRTDRIRRGIRSAVLLTTGFCLAVSAAVVLSARPLTALFVPPGESEIVAAGVQYLRIEGSFYIGIGYLFLLYGFYRAVRMPGMSVVLTVLSLGTRVALAYALAAVPDIGLKGIWWSVPAGWALADLVGILYYRRRKMLRTEPHSTPRTGPRTKEL